MHRAFVELDLQSGAHADLDALAFVQIVTVHTMAIERLGALDPQFLLPAMAAARAAYEAATAAAWLVEPTDAAERERRWLRLFVTEMSDWRVMKDEAAAQGDPAETLAGFDAEIVRVQNLLMGLQPLTLSDERMPQFPNVPQRLREINESESYVMYRVACQFVHPASRSLGQVRSLTVHADAHPPITLEFCREPRDWSIVLLLAGVALDLAAGVIEKLRSRVEPPRGQPLDLLPLYVALHERAERLLGA